jgi:uncharacterized iron-regulated membrane protein
MKFKSWLRQAHLWMAFVAGLPLLIVAVTGALLVFPDQTRTLLSGVPSSVLAASTRLSYTEMVRRMDAQLERDEQANRLVFSAAPAGVVRASTTKGRSITFDPYRGDVLELSERSGVMDFVVRLHASLTMGRPGVIITGITSGLLCLLGLTGIILWWPVGRWSANYFRIRTVSGLRRFNFDLHRVGGFYASVIMFPIGFSGCWMAFGSSLDPIVYAITGTTSEQVRPPKDIAFERHPAVTPDDAVAAASAEFPGWLVYRLYVPTPQVPYYRVFLNASDRFEARTNEARLWVHPVTGLAKCEQDPRTWSAGDAICAWKLPLHFGTFGGLATRWLYLGGTLMPVVLTATGVIIWARRNGKRRRAFRPFPCEHSAQIAAHS